jgi:outer membrane protein OmpA-like peptidoglycan-associated protein
MNMRIAIVLTALLLAAATAPTFAASASEHELAVARLQAQLQELDADPSLADLGGLERLKARQAIEAARDAKRRERDHRAALAGLRVRTARIAAEAELLETQARQLDRERDEIMVESSRLEAERARREAQRLQLLAIAREEASQRERDQEEAAQAAALELAGAETAQARKLAAARAREAELARREAELAAEIAADDIVDASAPPVRREGGRDIYTLDGAAFATGSATLTAGAQASLRVLAARLRGGDARVSIEGHTDSQGADNANLFLSRQRAESVRRSLEDAGLPAARLESSGYGEARPVADNSDAAGRARNRRVEIIVD